MFKNAFIRFVKWLSAANTSFDVRKNADKAWTNNKVRFMSNLHATLLVSGMEIIDNAGDKA
jgi:hypothetical protein